jgi:hypothetical protein
MLADIRQQVFHRIRIMRAGRDDKVALRSVVFCGPSSVESTTVQLRLEE